jgi:DNA-directed RNA polymerase specialized sigma24 family protein
VVDETNEQSFIEFAHAAEPRLRHALTPLFGADRGREATTAALTYGWEHWGRVRHMDNPVGYLYAVGRSRGRRASRRKIVFPTPPVDSTPWVEPALPEALAALPLRQRQVVMLIHGYGWTQSEVAEVLGVSKPTVQTHLTRAVDSLRSKLGVQR